jgi:hypothetical protein
LSTIGHQGVFRLRRWSSRIHTEFHGLRATWEHARESRRFHVRGYHPLCRWFPPSSATHAIYNSLPGRQSRPGGPATPVTQRLPALTRNEFGLFPFRSPLLRESRLLSLPAGTEMFHFPALPPPALCVQAGVTGNYARSGFPIRKSPDRRLVADSPGLIAGSYVLHRLLVPRHPPCALNNLATTLQITCKRCSRPLCSSQDTDRHQPRTPHPRETGTSPAKEGTPVPSGPNSVPGHPGKPARRSSPPTGRAVLTRADQLKGQPNNQCSTSERWTRHRTLAGLTPGAP